MAVPEKNHSKVFTLLFGAAVLFYHGEISFWTRTPFSWLAVLAAALAILFPASMLSLPSLCVAVALELGWALPAVNTNQMVCLFTALTVLGGWIVGQLTKPSRDHWTSIAFPALRIELVIVYLWAGWHKLNRDFFDLDRSSAAFLYRDFGAKVHHAIGFSLIPELRWAVGIAIWTTVLIEIGVPLLLFTRRYRGAALGVLLAFQVILGLGGFYGFSVTMIALLTLFAAPELLERFQTMTGWAVWIARAGVAAMLGAGIVATVHPVNTHGVFRVIWLIGIIVSVGWVVRMRPWISEDSREWAPSFSMRPVMWVFPLAVFVNGLSPYIGLKTEGSFAMYSNLRTEGGTTNHFIWRAPLPVFGNLDDLVVIKHSSDPGLERLAMAKHPIPWIGLRLRIERIRNDSAGPVSLTYVRKASEVSVDNVLTSPEFARAPSWVQRKLLNFRDILPAGENGFSH